MADRDPLARKLGARTCAMTSARTGTEARGDSAVQTNLRDEYWCHDRNTSLVLQDETEGGETKQKV
jgi:hypothetical protein